MKNLNFNKLESLTDIYDIDEHADDGIDESVMDDTSDETDQTLEDSENGES